MSETDSSLDLLDFRRRVFALHDEVRRIASRDARAAHARWREARDELFAAHPQSAIPPSRPLAGPESRLAARVEAGKMSWGGAHP